MQWRKRVEAVFCSKRCWSEEAEPRCAEQAEGSWRGWLTEEPRSRAEKRPVEEGSLDFHFFVFSFQTTPVAAQM
jgi:hypothetical protein